MAETQEEFSARLLREMLEQGQSIDDEIEVDPMSALRRPQYMEAGGVDSPEGMMQMFMNRQAPPPRAGGSAGETMEEIFKQRDEPMGQPEMLERRPFRGPNIPLDVLEQQQADRLRERGMRDPADSVPNAPNQDDMLQAILEHNRSKPNVPLPLPRYPDVDIDTGNKRVIPQGDLRRSDIERRLEEVLNADDMLGGVEENYRDLEPYAAPGHELTDEELVDQIMNEPHPFEAVGKGTDADNPEPPTEGDIRLLRRNPDAVLDRFIDEFGPDAVPEDLRRKDLPSEIR